MNGRGEPNWQPISMLATIASLIDGGLSDAREHYAMLLKARLEATRIYTRPSAEDRTRALDLLLTDE